MTRPPEQLEQLADDVVDLIRLEIEAAQSYGPFLVSLQGLLDTYPASSSHGDGEDSEAIATQCLTVARAVVDGRLADPEHGVRIEMVLAISRRLGRLPVRAFSKPMQEKIDLVEKALGAVRSGQVDSSVRNVSNGLSSLEESISLFQSSGKTRQARQDHARSVLVSVNRMLRQLQAQLVGHRGVKLAHLVKIAVDVAEKVGVERPEFPAHEQLKNLGAILGSDIQALDDRIAELSSLARRLRTTWRVIGFDAEADVSEVERQIRAGDMPLRLRRSLAHTPEEIVTLERELRFIKEGLRWKDIGDFGFNVRASPLDDAHDISRHREHVAGARSSLESSVFTARRDLDDVLQQLPALKTKVSAYIDDLPQAPQRQEDLVAIWRDMSDLHRRTEQCVESVEILCRGYAYLPQSLTNSLREVLGVESNPVDLPNSDVPSTQVRAAGTSIVQMLGSLLDGATSHGPALGEAVKLRDALRSHEKMRKQMSDQSPLAQRERAFLVSETVKGALDNIKAPILRGLEMRAKLCEQGWSYLSEAGVSEGKAHEAISSVIERYSDEILLDSMNRLSEQALEIREGLRDEKTSEDRVEELIDAALRLPDLVNTVAEGLEEQAHDRA